MNSFRILILLWKKRMCFFDIHRIGLKVHNQPTLVRRTKGMLIKSTNTLDSSELFLSPVSKTKSPPLVQLWNKGFGSLEENTKREPPWRRPVNNSPYPRKFLLTLGHHHHHHHHLRSQQMTGTEIHPHSQLNGSHDNHGNFYN